MPCQLSEEVNNVNDDVFSYMCNLAMEKCSRKMEKKRASCGGAAMRKRLLIKNFVAQMLAQEKQTREQSLLSASGGARDDDSQNHQKSFDDSCNSSSSTSSSSTSSTSSNGGMEIDEDEEEEQDEEEEAEEEEESELNTSQLEDEQEEEEDGEDEEAEKAAAAILAASAKDKKAKHQPADNNNNRSMTISPFRRPAHRPQMNRLPFLRRRPDHNSDDEDEAVPLQQQHDFLMGTTRTARKPCWRSGPTKVDEDDFHRVPIPRDQMAPQIQQTNRMEEEDDEMDDGRASKSPPAAENDHQHHHQVTNHWPFYDDHRNDGHGYGGGQFPADLLGNENILAMDGSGPPQQHHQQQLKMATAEEEDVKLFLLGRDHHDDPHHQLIGLVNMVPSSVKFSFGPSEMSPHHNDAAAAFYQDAGGHCLTELDNVGLGGHHVEDYMHFGSRKRPWSLVFDSHQQMMMMDIQQQEEAANGAPQQLHQEHEEGGTMLPPLCCGLLQLQPFGGHQADPNNGLPTGGAALQQPLMKRVKL